VPPNASLTRTFQARATQPPVTLPPERTPVIVTPSAPWANYTASHLGFAFSYPAN
jgi:hypothetical protein